MSSGRVLAGKGARHVYEVTPGQKEQITTLVGFNAAGEFLPPMILFSGQCLRDLGLGNF